MRTRHYTLITSCLYFIACLLCGFSFFAHAQEADFSVRIVGAGDTTSTIALATPTGTTSRARELQQLVKTNLNMVPFIRTIDGAAIPGGAVLSSSNSIDLKPFSMAGAQFVVAAHWPTEMQVELSLYAVASNRWIFGNRYDLNGPDGFEEKANIFCDDLLQHLIGKSALFRSTLAFVKSDGPRKKDIWSVKVNGKHLRKLTHLKGEALSPTWSYDGREILFSHIDARSHGLGVWDSATKTTKRIKFPGNTVIGPCFLPDKRVAVSLTDGRNPSIFLLSSSFQKLGRLDNSPSIDVSPSVDSSGSKMAFTSNRLGNPHIFLKNLQTGLVQRISQGGNYNSDPSISPDGSFVVFARLEGGGHKLFVYDLTRNQERQITFGPGSDEAPEFCSDGYFIAFMSNRNGRRQLFLTTRAGDAPKLIPTGSGDAQFPAWNKIQ